MPYPTSKQTVQAAAPKPIPVHGVLDFYTQHNYVAFYAFQFLSFTDPAEGYI
jgi:hypothetical protein